jgi:D-xylose transport system substrate-binding protein
MAAGALQALQEAGRSGNVAISGALPDVYGLKRVFAGTQVVSAWEDRAGMGTAAAQAAIALCANPDITRISDAKEVTSPGGNKMWQRLFQPQAVTKDNIDVVLKADPYTKRAFCDDETLAATPLCK